MKEKLIRFNMVYNSRMWHFTDNFKYEWVYPICFLSDCPNILGQVTVTCWTKIFFYDAYF